MVPTRVLTNGRRVSCPAVGQFVLCSQGIKNRQIQLTNCTATGLTETQPRWKFGGRDWTGARVRPVHFGSRIQTERQISLW